MKEIVRIKLILIIISSIVLFSIFGCREDALIYPEEPSSGGAIWINSSPAGASIFLDGRFTQKITPDWLTELNSGDYFISLKLEGFADTTLKINIDPDVKRYLLVRLHSSN